MVLLHIRRVCIGSPNSLGNIDVTADTLFRESIRVGQGRAFRTKRSHFLLNCTDTSYSMAHPFICSHFYGTPFGMEIGIYIQNVWERICPNFPYFLLVRVYACIRAYTYTCVAVKCA